MASTYTTYIHTNDRYKILYYSVTDLNDQYFIPLGSTIKYNGTLTQLNYHLALESKYQRSNLNIIYNSIINLII